MTRNSRGMRIGFGLLLCLVACSCVITETEHAPLPGEPVVTVTPSVTPTPLSAFPTQESAQMPTPAVSSLSDDGPWALVLNQEGIWAANEDGSGLTQLTQDVVHQRTIVVSGRWAAYATFVGAGSDPEGHGDLTLKLLSLPEGISRTVTGLDIPGVNSDSSDDLQFAAEQVYRAVVWRGGLAWSPDGSKLAFVSGHDGASADVYVYSLDTGEIVRLTDGPSHAYQLSWSPDGQYIFHTGASNFGSGAGYAMEGVWTARADDTGVRSLYEPDPRSGAEKLVDWLSADTVLVNSWRPDCGDFSLIKVNVVSGELEVLWSDYFNQVVYNPDTDTVLIDAYDIACDIAGRIGFYLLESGSTQLEQISDEEYHARLPDPPHDPVSVTLDIEVESLIWMEPY